MPVPIQSIFKDVAPYKVALDLGLPIFEDAQRSYCRVPQLADRKFWLNRDAFISDTPDDFVAGDIFDFLAKILGDYQQAVDYVLANYSALAAGQPDLNAHRTYYASALQQQRQEFLDILGLRKNLETRSMHFAALINWLEAKGIDYKHCSKFLFAAEGQELRGLLENYEEHSKIHTATNYLVLPYFNNYHSISQLVIYPTGKDKPIVVQMKSASQAFFGLPTINPGLTDIRTLNTAESTARYFSKARSLGNYEFGVVHVMFSKGVPETAIKLPSAVFVHTPGTELAQVAKTRGAFDEMMMDAEVDSLLGAKTIRKEPWVLYAMRQFQTFLVNDRHISPRIHQFLDACRYDPEVIKAMENWMTELKQYEIVKLLRKYTLVPRMQRIGDINIDETDSGYFISTDTNTRPVHCTDFTVRMYKSVWFKETDETYNFGVLYHQGRSFEFKVSNKDMEKTDRLMIVLEAAVKHSSDGKDNYRPAILNNKFKGCLPNLIRMQMNSCGNSYGIHRLGWNAKRTMFNTPAWRAEISQLDESVREGNPAVSALRNYMFQEFNKADAYTGLTDQMRSYIALVASMTTRLFMKAPFPVVSVQHTANSQNFLTSLFLAFNQSSPFELNVNQRREVMLVPDEVSCIPTFGTCSTGVDLSKHNGCIIALCKTGTIFNEKLDTATHLQLMTCNYRVQSQLAVWLLRNVSNVVQLLNPSPRTTNDYIVEGKKLIETATQFKTFEVLFQATPVLLNLLAGVPYEDLGKHFRHDGEHVEILCSKLEVVREDLRDDLKNIDEKVELVKSRNILTAAAPILEVLQKYYGRAVELPSIKSQQCC